MENLKMRKKVIFALGKIELAIGCVMVAFGIFSILYSDVTRRSFQFNQEVNQEVNQGGYNVYSMGEGVWCGTLVIVAGSLGMGAGGSKSSPCLINTHMAFSIVGSLASATLCSLTGVFASISSRVPFYCSLMSTFSILSFATAILLIVSASYCCCANPRGCCGGCCDQQVYDDEQNYQNMTITNPPRAVHSQGYIPQRPTTMTTTASY